MTKSRSTKNALISSILVLALCFSMLLGTTFAWFTDTAASNDNKVVSGTLDVELWQHTGTGESDKVNISDSHDALFTDDILWEPNRTEVVYLSIKNNGSLALKYKVAIDVSVDSNVDLTEVMEYDIIENAQYGSVTAWADEGTAVVPGANETQANDVKLLPGDVHYFALAVHMDKDAGNKYQGQSISFDIKVLAGQATEESDAFGDQYDADALYAIADGLYVDSTSGKYVANSTKGLVAVAELASSDSSITSVTYTTEEGDVEVPVASDNSGFESAIDSGNEVVVLTSGSYQMPDGTESTDLRGKELSVVGTEDTVVDVSVVDTRDQFVTGAEILFEGVTLNFGTADYYGFANVKSLTYKGCTISGYQYLLADNVIFDDCIINSTGYCINTYSAKNITIKGCTFNSAGKAILVYKDDPIVGEYSDLNVTKMVVEGCTFKASAPGYAGAISNMSCAAIEIHNYRTGVNLTTSGNTIASNFSGEWRIKTYEDTSIYGNTVTVNGTEYTQCAVDGRLFTVSNKEATFN